MAWPLSVWVWVFVECVCRCTCICGGGGVVCLGVLWGKDSGVEADLCLCLCLSVCECVHMSVHESLHARTGVCVLDCSGQHEAVYAIQ